MSPRRTQYRACVVIPADDSLPVRVISEQTCELEALQKLVGGHLELVRISRSAVRELEQAYGVELGRGAELWCNEEGKLEGLPYNHRASVIWGNPADLIMGDAFVMAVP